MFDQVKLWARNIKRDLIALYLAAHDARTPKIAKVLAVLIVAYALSPIDLIPDFIPVFGLIDDVIFVPLGIMLTIRLIPVDLMVEHRARALEIGRLPSNKKAAVFIVFTWMIIIAVVICWMTAISVGQK